MKVYIRAASSSYSWPAIPEQEFQTLEELVSWVKNQSHDVIIANPNPTGPYDTRDPAALYLTIYDDYIE